MTQTEMYCSTCGFPVEYCEYSPTCTKEKKDAVAKEMPNVTVSTKRVSGNKKVTLVRNLHTMMTSTQMKEIAKKCSKAIACGSSIVKNGSGTEDVLVQTAEDMRVIEILTKNGVHKNKIERITK